MSWRMKTLQRVQRRVFSNLEPSGARKSRIRMFPIVFLTGIGGAGAYLYSNPEMQNELQIQINNLMGSAPTLLKVPTAIPKVQQQMEKATEEVDLQTKLQMLEKKRKMEENQKNEEMKRKMEGMKAREKLKAREKAKREEEEKERKRKAEELEKIKKAKVKELEILERKLGGMKSALEEIKLQNKREEEAKAKREEEEAKAKRIEKEKAAALEDLNQRVQLLKNEATEMEAKAKKEARKHAGESTPPSLEQQKQIASLEEKIKNLEKEKHKLKKSLKKKTKQAEKYHAFLQDHLVPLQKGKGTFEQAVARYHALEGDMQDHFVNSQERLQEDAERRVESLVEVQKRMKAVDLTLGEMSKEQIKRNEILRCRSSVQNFEERFLDGDSVVNEVDHLKKIFSDNPFISTVLNQVDQKFAKEGFKTPEELQASFKTVEKKCRASFLNQKVPKDNAFAQAVSTLFSNLLVFEPALRNGDDPDSILSTTGYWVQNMDLYKALDKLKPLQKLNAPAGDELDLWISQVEARLNAEQILSVIKSHLLLQADRTN